MFRWMACGIALVMIAWCTSAVQAGADVVMHGKTQAGGKISLGCHDTILPGVGASVVGGGKVTTPNGQDHHIAITGGVYSKTAATLFGVMDGNRPFKIVGTVGTNGNGVITMTLYAPIGQPPATPSVSVARGTVTTK